MMQEDHGFSLPSLISSLSLNAPKRKARGRFGTHFAIHEDLADSTRGSHAIDSVNSDLKVNARIQNGSGRPSTLGAVQGIAQETFPGGPRKHASIHQVESHISKEPRRKTMYIPSEDTAIFTIHPRARTYVKQTAIACSPGLLPNAHDISNQDQYSAVMSENHAKPLRAAPRRSSLLPARACRTNIATPITVYGSGPGKENVPPGMHQLRKERDNHNAAVNQLPSPNRKSALPIPKDSAHAVGQNTAQMTSLDRPRVRMIPPIMSISVTDSKILYSSQEEMQRSLSTRRAAFPTLPQPPCSTDSWAADITLCPLAPARCRLELYEDD